MCTAFRNCNVGAFLELRTHPDVATDFCRVASKLSLRADDTSTLSSAKEA